MSERNKQVDRDKHQPARSQPDKDRHEKRADQQTHPAHHIPGADGFIGAEAEEDNNP